MIETLIVMNPKARGGTLGAHWERLEKQILDALRIEKAEVLMTPVETQGVHRVRDALKKGVKNVVVVGGDGTISEVIQGFFEDGKAISPQTVLSIMPAGRGDDFFKTMSGTFSLSSQSAWKKGLEILRAGTPKAVDVGWIKWILQSESRGSVPETRYFMNITGFGFTSYVANQIQQRRSEIATTSVGKSAWIYVVKGLSAMKTYRPISVEIKIDGRDFYRGEITYGLVLNGRYSAGGVCWDPEAVINDGLFNLVVTQPRAYLSDILRMAQLISGKKQGLDGVLHAQGRRIEIRVITNEGPSEREDKSTPHPICEVDGEVPENVAIRGAVLELLPSAVLLRMLR